MVMMVALALPSLAQQRGPDWPTDGPPPHGHMLVLDVQVVDEEPVGFAKCIDLANNQVIPRNAHHEHQHVGTAGAAHFQSGDWVVPTVLSGFANCAELEAVFN
jgi:hypothetical protein